jgi:hypothetical protein
LIASKYPCGVRQGIYAAVAALVFAALTGLAI